MPQQLRETGGCIIISSSPHSFTFFRLWPTPTSNPRCKTDSRTFFCQSLPISAMLSPSDGPSEAASLGVGAFNGIACGQWSLNAVIESTAQRLPDKAFGQVITSLEPVHAKVVTFSNLLGAICQGAWLMEGSNPTLQQILWYTGASDLRYIVFTLAASRAGHKVTWATGSKQLQLQLIRPVDTPDISQEHTRSSSPSSSPNSMSPRIYLRCQYKSPGYGHGMRFTDSCFSVLR